MVTWFGVTAAADDGGAPVPLRCVPAGHARFGRGRVVVGHDLKVRAALAAVSDPAGQVLAGRLRQHLRGLTDPLARCALTPEGAAPGRWQVTLDLVLPVHGDGRVLQVLVTDPDHTLERACVDRALAPLDLRGAGAPPRVRVVLALSRQREPRYAPAEEPPTCPAVVPGAGGGGVGEGTIGLGGGAAPPRAGSCFHWVHLADFGVSCHATRAICERERARGFPPGRGDTTPCEAPKDTRAQPPKR